MLPRIGERRERLFNHGDDHREASEYIARKRRGDLQGPVLGRRTVCGRAPRSTCCGGIRTRRDLPGRLSRVFYQNYIGSIVDWYASTLMHREPALMLEGTDAGAKNFTAAGERLELKGTSLRSSSANDSWKRGIRLELPGGGLSAHDGAGADAAEETPRGRRGRTGGLRRGRSHQLELRPHGGMDWAYPDVMYSAIESDGREVGTGNALDYYDRENYQIYRKAGEGSRSRESTRAARAGLAGRVPLFQMRVTEGLWLMNRAALLQLDTSTSRMRWVGADDGAVRNAGVYSDASGTDGGRVVLHTT